MASWIAAIGHRVGQLAPTLVRLHKTSPCCAGQRLLASVRHDAACVRESPNHQADSGARAGCAWAQPFDNCSPRRHREHWRQAHRRNLRSPPASSSLLWRSCSNPKSPHW